jgi:hypothetical protein
VEFLGKLIKPIAPAFAKNNSTTVSAKIIAKRFRLLKTLDGGAIDAGVSFVTLAVSTKTMLCLRFFWQWLVRKPSLAFLALNLIL